jgi:hypothetical protein
VQIVGLSRAVFERGLAAGHMPYTAKMLARGGHQLHPMSVGMPTSTPAFQMAAMYGVQPDIPGFHYHDKRRRADIHFPRPGHAAGVEAAHVAGRLGILCGGSVYGCVFTGGAENDLARTGTQDGLEGLGFARFEDAPTNALCGANRVVWFEANPHVLELRRPLVLEGLHGLD